jgi:hypothetical protein
VLSDAPGHSRATVAQRDHFSGADHSCSRQPASARPDPNAEAPNAPTNPALDRIRHSTWLGLLSYARRCGNKVGMGNRNCRNPLLIAAALSHASALDAGGPSSTLARPSRNKTHPTRHGFEHEAQLERRGACESLGQGLPGHAVVREDNEPEAASRRQPSRRFASGI